MRGISFLCLVLVLVLSSFVLDAKPLGTPSSRALKPFLLELYSERQQTQTKVEHETTATLFAAIAEFRSYTQSKADSDALVNAFRTDFKKYCVTDGNKDENIVLTNAVKAEKLGEVKADVKTLFDAWCEFRGGVDVGFGNRDSPKKVAVVGGGVTGFSTALWILNGAKKDKYLIHVYELRSNYNLEHVVDAYAKKGFGASKSKKAAVGDEDKASALLHGMAEVMDKLKAKDFFDKFDDKVWDSGKTMYHVTMRQLQSFLSFAFEVICRDEDKFYMSFEVKLEENTAEQTKVATPWKIGAKFKAAAEEKTITKTHEAVKEVFKKNAKNEDVNDVKDYADIDTKFKDKILQHHYSTSGGNTDVADALYAYVVLSCGAGPRCDEYRTKLATASTKDPKYELPAVYANHKHMMKVKEKDEFKEVEVAIKPYITTIVILQSNDDKSTLYGQLKTAAQTANSKLVFGSDFATVFAKFNKHFFQVELIYNAAKDGGDPGVTFMSTLAKTTGFRAAWGATVATTGVDANDIKKVLTLYNVENFDVFKGKEKDLLEHVHEVRIWKNELRVFHYKDTTKSDNPVLVAQAKGLFGVGDFLRDAATSAAMGVNHGHQTAYQLAKALEDDAPGAKYDELLGVETIVKGLIQDLYADTIEQAQKHEEVEDN